MITAAGWQLQQRQGALQLGVNQAFRGSIAVAGILSSEPSGRGGINAKDSMRLASGCMKLGSGRWHLQE